MKLLRTSIILFFALMAGACNNTEKKQEIQFDTAQCEGRPHYIGLDKEDFLYIFGPFDRQVDSIGYTFVYWDEIDVNMHYDSNNKVIDYTIK